ncbi:hypothetical protein BU23DRAFT_634622 [Bimuria novae-zelandiae CBS 107.79]|uniref:Uncharacterized protein n=1 Tax=Bimuria novae-zelandiae CBS 107.79 TaxID=1447943 RepID=A0A6A5UGI8_9PLEO|nr:hypothetical protein BU23DRAFT_634622 [Bimuria novae-zelandiae CBS 107.79]
MASQQQSRISASRSRRAANNNYLKLSKTLYEKLAKLCVDYDTEVYFLAYRNGRFNGFVSTDKAGQPWMPPDQEALILSRPDNENARSLLSSFAKAEGVAAQSQHEACVARKWDRVASVSLKSRIPESSVTAFMPPGRLLYHTAPITDSVETGSHEWISWPGRKKTPPLHMFHQRAIFYSPRKVQRARDALREKEAAEAEEQRQKQLRATARAANKAVKERLASERRAAQAEAAAVRAAERARKAQKPVDGTKNLTCRLEYVVVLLSPDENRAGKLQEERFAQRVEGNGGGFVCWFAASHGNHQRKAAGAYARIVCGPALTGAWDGVRCAVA